MSRKYNIKFSGKPPYNAREWIFFAVGIGFVVYAVVSLIIAFATGDSTLYSLVALALGGQFISTADQYRIERYLGWD